MIDIIEALRFAADTGVLALIWLVQLVIYPGLTKYSDTSLKNWHPIYTKNVTFVVLPLMFLQLGLSISQVWSIGGFSDFMHLLLVLIAWVVTFTKAVPLHQSIETSVDGIEIAHRLVEINRLRTLVWTLAWIISLISILI